MPPKSRANISSQSIYNTIGVYYGTIDIDMTVIIEKSVNLIKRRQKSDFRNSVGVGRSSDCPFPFESRPKGRLPGKPRGLGEIGWKSYCA